MKRLFVLTILASLACPQASAKDLRGRLGAGFDVRLGNVPGLSVRWGLPIPSDGVHLALEAAGGLSLVPGEEEKVFTGGRLLWTVVLEDNCNVYVAGGAFWVHEGAYDAFRAQPSLGVEFFPFALDNLGFGAEYGVNLDFSSSGSRVFGASGTPVAGVHYYF